jgi:hypothetical protein
LEELLTEYEDCRRSNKVYHRVDTGDARPIRQPPRRIPLAKQAEVNEMLDMQRRGVIEELDNPRLSPVVLVRKKKGELRVGLDYRKLNDVTKKDFSTAPD